MLDRKISIDTERLIMKPFAYGDEDAIFRILKDREMYRYTPDKPWESLADAKEFIKLTQWLYDMNYSTFRHFFAVTLRESRTIIGYCGVGGIEYDRTENEVFYSIGKDYWGMGYATEAARAMLGYAFSSLGLMDLIGVVDQKNTASNRVMEKIGMQWVGVISGLPEEHDYYNGENLYQLTQEDYLKLPKHKR